MIAKPDCRDESRAGRRCTILLAAGALSLAFMALAPSPSHAQSIDYGALEQLFGESVTTSATGSPQRVTEVPANMEIVTADEIRRSGAYDIPGVLRHVLGVDVLQWNNDNADLGLRGYDQTFSPRVLVLIDGRQVYADHYGYIPWSSLPVELTAIRQIEIVKGPNSALFGFNAVSGVINIITYNPLYDEVNVASVSGGTQGMAQASGVQTFRFDRGALRLSAGGRRNSDFSTPIPASEGMLLRKDGDHFSFDANGIIRLTDRVELGIEASHAGAASNNLNPVYSLENDQHFATSIKGQLTADTEVGLLQVTVYTNWTSQHAQNDRQAPIDFDDEVTVVQLQDIFRLGTDHIFRISTEFRHNEVGTTPLAGGTVFYNVYSAGGMWNWSITPSVSLTNAFRFDDLALGRSGSVPPGYPFTNSEWDRTIAQWSYNTGLVWQAGDSDAVRLLASRGVQLPSLASFGAFVLVSPFARVTGTPNMNPAVVTNYEIDWDHALSGLGAKFRAAVFYQRSENLITVGGGSFRIAGGPLYSGQTNVGASIGRGLEMSLTGVFEEYWRWGVNYRYEAISDHFKPIAAGGTKYLDFQHVTPAHVVKANFGWSRGDWEVDTYAYYQSATRGLEGLSFGAGSFLTPVQAYLSADARIAYRLTDWATISISGQNLLESPQQQTSGPKVERRVFGTLTVRY
jgi:outer membrane receptor for ferrienterochelin and colicins